MKKTHSILFQVGGVLQEGTREVSISDLSLPLRNGSPNPSRFLTGFYGHKGKRAGLTEIYGFAASKYPENPVMIAEVEVTMRQGIILGVIKEDDVSERKTNFMNMSRMSSAFSEVIYKLWDDCSKMSVRSPKKVTPTSPASYVPSDPRCIEAIFDAFPGLCAVAYPAVTEYGKDVVQVISVDLTRCGPLSASSYNKEIALIPY